MRTNPRNAGLAVKVIAGVAVVACLVVGAIGLVLPIVPGILFLALAALIAARFSPTFERALRRNRTMGSYLDKTAGFSRLSLPRQIQLGAWLALKAVVDSFAWMAAACGRFLRRVR